MTNTEIAVLGVAAVGIGAYFILKKKGPTIWTFADHEGNIKYSGPDYAAGLKAAGGVWVNHQWIPANQLPLRKAG